ncbi:MAG: outer membrane protein [Gemmatimonadaceae bacterium]|jgi:TolC family type I secretion outer membrane protein|nr:outer membrane protein [Gemmatimonadaceae bacterium]
MGPPSVNGAPGAPPAPNVPWKAPAGAIKPEPLITAATALAVPPDLEQRIQQLALADVVDLALRNNPATRASWAQARASADLLGSARGQYFPTINGTGTVSRIQSPATTTRPAGTRTEYGPSLNLNYLLADFGGRSGSIERARQTMFAASLSHNATLQNTVLQAEAAYFTYMATVALLGAEQSAIAEASASLTAAQSRFKVGLATIADVLQAKTALSQEQLNLETTQGNLQAARGGLAAALGLPANLPFDLAPMPATIPVGMVSVSVDSVINAALRNRPDLAAARAQAAAAAAQVRVARSAEFPSLTLGSTAGRTYSNPSTFAGPSYSVTLGLALPIFNGFSRQYDLAAARAQAEAISALADQTRQQVVTQVFVSYYALQTAEQRVATADDLLASAQQSVQVAAGRYREGVGSIIDLLTAQTALASARAQQVQSRWQWYTSLAQLARDAGVLGVRGETPFSFTPDSLVSPQTPSTIRP